MGWLKLKPCSRFHCFVVRLGPCLNHNPESSVVSESCSNVCLRASDSNAASLSQSQSHLYPLNLILSVLLEDSMNTQSSLGTWKFETARRVHVVFIYPFIQQASINVRLRTRHSAGQKQTS